MAYGIVLRPGPDASRDLVALSHAVGGDADPIMLLDAQQAPPHVSVLHAAGALEPFGPVALDVRIIGLLYAVIPAGDYYVPSGGYYFGLEIVRRPDLNALHQRYLAVADGPLGQVGDDYRPHITLGVTARRPALPIDDVPTGTLPVTLAAGPVGPYGTFPRLRTV
jgi:hypothetical protein